MRRCEGFRDQYMHILAALFGGAVGKDTVRV
jgi:hypothetical protein